MQNIRTCLQSLFLFPKTQNTLIILHSAYIQGYLNTIHTCCGTRTRELYYRQLLLVENGYTHGYKQFLSRLSTLHT